MANLAVPHYLTRHQVAHLLSISLPTLDRRVLSGDLPAPKRVLGLLRYQTSDLIDAGLLDRSVFALGDVA